MVKITCHTGNYGPLDHFYVPKRFRFVLPNFEASKYKMGAEVSGREDSHEARNFFALMSGQEGGPLVF
jgi:hypothetical protein